MRRTRRGLALAAMLLAGCGGDSTGSSGVILLQDNCDPATFNAGMGAGTCLRSSTVLGLSLEDFIATLQAGRSVAAWHIEPGTLSLEEGSTVSLYNAGGETHTYTEVAEFGGGAIPLLNQLSGNLVVAPECVDGLLYNASTVRSGEIAAHAFHEKGTWKFQCCIHPWMRQTVTVR
jgi:plastocyanin